MEEKMDNQQRKQEGEMKYLEEIIKQNVENMGLDIDKILKEVQELGEDQKKQGIKGKDLEEQLAHIMRSLKGL